MTPARITEPGVGACTCASGSQVWNGNSGTLMMNASVNARNIQYCVPAGICSSYSLSRSKLYSPVTDWCTHDRPMIATSISTLPAMV